ncbi:MAG: diguanylate cyclase, partial [Planctomycetales bacterium]|nr:diguanylate cyclase [Planctomycetales bacterium]
APRGDRISGLLQSLEEVASQTGHATLAPDPRSQQHEDRLVDARLGVASSLFAALRCKHPPTAAHCLRVAIGCSQWAAAMKMPDELRTQLEVAALLHDIGKIGIPDNVLLKQSRLQPDELAVLQRHTVFAREILRHAGAPPELAEIIVSSGAWYDGSRAAAPLAGDQIPVLSRVLAIVDAFDSMTTDHVYRPAKSTERAVAELYECAGTQFDPGMVKHFVQQLSKDPGPQRAEVAKRWLASLEQTSGGLPWAPGLATLNASPSAQGGDISLFERELIDHMHDGVVFVDPQRQITLWNTGAERLTGVASNAALGQTLMPSLLVMSAPDGRLLSDNECPVAKAISTGASNTQRMSVIGRKGKHVEVDLHSIPVCAPDGVRGATVLIHDASSEASLEQRCQALHAEMTKDPMTQVANRAEFDRALAMFVDAHQETGLPCSLIMSDIDHFKSINDTYGHQAGDEAIVTFASLLKSLCRTGDLVARYGGEEFAVLCADCNNATAAFRAEQMRRKLSETPQQELGGKCITASFGVSELQAGDTPETLLRRSDRALLQAKDQGRNQVVQLGAGMAEDEPKKSWWGGFTSWGKSLIETTLLTNVPIEVAVEKLKGFIADHDARILKTQEHEIRVECRDLPPGMHKRKTDRPVTFIIDLKLSEEMIDRENAAGLAKGKYAQTTAQVTIRPRHERDRRRGYATDRARKLLGSLKSYLMAKEADLEAAPAK